MLALLYKSKRICLAGRAARGRIGETRRQKRIFPSGKIGRQPDLVDVLRDPRLDKAYCITGRSARAMKHSTRHGAELSRIALFVQMHQLKVRGLDAVRVLMRKSSGVFICVALAPPLRRPFTSPLMMPSVAMLFSTPPVFQFTCSETTGIHPLLVL